MRNIARILLATAGFAMNLAAQSPLDRRDYLVPSETTYLCQGDFNNDGIPDLAVNNDDSSGVSIFLGAGDGTFRQPAIQAATGEYPSAVTTADVNGDHKLDLIVIPLDSIDGTFELLLGNGDGTFQAPQEIPIPSFGTVSYVVAADLNHDGNPDLLFAAVALDEVIILLGNGDGTFQAPEILTHAGYFALGDFNNDGNLDLAVSTTFYAQSFRVLLGNGDGTFESPISNSYYGAPLASADFNGDGLADIVLNYNLEAVFVSLSNGDGTFQEPVVAPLKNPSFSSVVTPAIGDVNGDGKPDLLIVQQSRDSQPPECCALAVLLGKGDGTFATAQDFQVGAFGVEESTDFLTVGDFNGDGKLDVAVPGGNFSGPDVTAGTVSVLLGNGRKNLFDVPPRFSYGSAGTGSAAASVAVGKRNSAGQFEVAVLNNADNQVVVFPVGKGSLGTPQTFGTSTSPVAVALVDVNHDGRLDLITANAGSNDVSVLLANAQGGFGPATSVPAGMAPGALGIGDFNGDGNPDVAVSDTQSSSLTILLGNGKGGFTVGSTPTLPSSPGAIAVADFNHDGIPDLAVTEGSTSSVSILLGDGKGNFTIGVGVATPLPAVSVASGDFNGDGTPDLAITVAEQSAYSSAFASDVVVAIGNGDGTFQAGTVYALPLGPAVIVLADVNGDGHLDLLTANAGNNDISALLGDGHGHFGVPFSVGADYSAFALAAADLNGDGLADVVVSNPIDNRVTLLTNILGVR